MKPIKRAIALCWIMLVACFLIKLFGGNWFEVVCTNEHFIKVCNFIDENAIVHQIASYLIYIVPSFFVLLSMSLIPKPTKVQILYGVLGYFLILSLKFININLKSAVEFIFLLVSPTIMNILSGNSEIKSIIKKTWYYGIVGYVLTFCMQGLSLVSKNVGIGIVNESLFVTFILLIDYYIMISLYYLYAKLRKERKNG